MNVLAVVVWFDWAFCPEWRAGYVRRVVVHGSDCHFVLLRFLGWDPRAAILKHCSSFVLLYPMNALLR
jgi:hypothetical protein